MRWDLKKSRAYILLVSISMKEISARQILNGEEYLMLSGIVRQPSWNLFIVITWSGDQDDRQ